MSTTITVAWVGIILSVLQQFVGINAVFYYSNTIWEAVGFAQDKAFFTSLINTGVNVVFTIVAIALIGVDTIGLVADGVRAIAARYEKSGHRHSAAPFYLRACKYYQMGERFRTPKDDIALAAYKKSIECFHSFAKLTDVKIEIVEVPYAGGSMPGYFLHANNAEGKRSPCVVHFDGLDITKEMLYMRGVPELPKRGISVLIMDGPGTGEAIRFRGQVLRHDYEVAGSACIDYLETRKDVDAKKIAVVANSLGGYYAPRCASMEPRFAACVAWGAIWDYHATWKKRVEAAFNAAMSVPGHHITWILGVNTVEEALKKLEPYKLDGVVQKMRCPFLITHGADDEQVPLADAQALYDAAARGKRWTLEMRRELVVLTEPAPLKV